MPVWYSVPGGAEKQTNKQKRNPLDCSKVEGLEMQSKNDQEQVLRGPDLPCQVV